MIGLSDILPPALKKGPGMAETVSPELEEFVRREIESGRFPNREAVLTHALRLFQRDREEAVAGIKAGLDDVYAGRVQPLYEAFADLRRELDVADE
jgi:putative addiction module CopG family antidote